MASRRKIGNVVPASARKAKAGIVHSVSGWMRGVQVKLWDPLRMRAILERFRGVFTTRHCTNPRLPYLTLSILIGRASKPICKQSDIIFFQARNYLPSHTAAPPLGLDKITLLGDRGTYVWITSSRMLHIDARLGVEPQSLHRKCDAMFVEHKQLSVRLFTLATV